MAELLTCVEHQSIPVRAQRLPGELAITTTQARQLDTSRSIPRDAYRWGNQCIQWRQFCGVIQLGGLTLEIVPKIYGSETDPGSSKAVLIKMLRRAGLMKVHRGSSASVHVQQQSLLDIFIREFCEQVQEQTLLGKPRAYRQIEANLTKLKGKLITNQQLRQNLVHRERLYCQFDELSEDIPLNRLVKFTLRLLLPQCRGNAAKKAVSEQLMQHDEISDCRFTVDDLDFIILDRTNDRYSDILRWCRLFIQTQNPDVTGGDHTLLSLLFDMNRLFEHWLAVELRPLAHSLELSVKEQSPRKYLAYRHDLDRPVFQTRPDISLVDSLGEVIWILDAKWKLLDPGENKLGVSQADLYQLSAYANLYGLDHVGLIYPRQAGLSPFYQLRLPGRQRVTVTIATVDLHRALREQWDLTNYSRETCTTTKICVGEKIQAIQRRLPPVEGTLLLN